MKRSLILIATAFAIAACAAQPASFRDLEDMANRQQREAVNRPAPDTCQMAAHQSLIGQTGSSIDQGSLPAGARVICHDCAVTLDYRAERLNVQLAPDGKVASLRCG